MAFSPKHHLTLADMPASAILTIIDTWTSLYRSHLAPSSPLRPSSAAPSIATSPSPDTTVVPSPAQLRYMQIFENKGSAMGCSNPHPHCQVWTTSYLPEEPALEAAAMRRYRAEHAGRHMLGEYVGLELRKGERVVWQNESFVVVCPWWAVWPFEMLVLPKRHVRALVDLSEVERMGLAEAVHEVTRRYDNLFQCSFPYSESLLASARDGSRNML